MTEFNKFFMEGIAELTQQRGESVKRILTGEMVQMAALDFERGQFVAENGGIIESADLIMTYDLSQGMVKIGEKFQLDTTIYYVKNVVGKATDSFVQLVCDLYQKNA